MFGEPELLRVAFTGASGTGKTTLAKIVAANHSLPMNPVGSRSVAADMGFASPYDVDKYGKRAEFQRRLALEKASWERARQFFVTDRAAIDNLAYATLHCIEAVTSQALDLCRANMRYYTHVVYCPVEVFQDTADDAARVHNRAYHEVYDCVVRAFVSRFGAPRTKFLTLSENTLEKRQERLQRFLSNEERHAR